MRFHRHRRLFVLLSSVFVLSSCGSPPNVVDPPPANPDVSVVTEAPGGLAGVVGQVDRARDVAGDLEQRNTSLEGGLP